MLISLDIKPPGHPTSIAPLYSSPLVHYSPGCWPPFVSLNMNTPTCPWVWALSQPVPQHGITCFLIFLPGWLFSFRPWTKWLHYHLLRKLFPNHPNCLSLQLYSIRSAHLYFITALKISNMFFVLMFIRSSF